MRSGRLRRERGQHGHTSVICMSPYRSMFRLPAVEQGISESVVPGTVAGAAFVAGMQAARSMVAGFATRRATGLVALAMAAPAVRAQ